MALNSSTGAGSQSTGGQSSKGSTSKGSSSKGSTSKGSSSTGSKTSSKTSTSGATTTNSTGNFSGGRLPGLGGQSFSSWSAQGPSSETDAAHASGVQGPGLKSGNFGSTWSGNGNHGSGSGSYTYNGTSYSGNKSEPVMTVDEVYGKIETSYGKPETSTGTSGNQPTVEKQGDYAASSNEKSEVKTSTPGKQEDITVTPVSITEDKGLVDNNTIESIEGLNFQQKDKESQDVMEAKKSRDEAEAEDKANSMKDKLKAVVENDAEVETDDFKVGEEVATNEKAALDEATKEYDDLQSQADERLAKYKSSTDKWLSISKDMPDVDVNDLSDGKTVTLTNGQEIKTYTYLGSDPEVKAYFDKFNAATENVIAEDKSFNDYVRSTNEAKAKVDKATEAYNNVFNNEESDKKQEQLLSQEQNIKNLAAERDKADKIYNEEADKLAEIGGKAAYDLQSLQDMSKAYNETSEGLLARNAPEDEVIKNDNNYISELQNLAKENNIDTSSWTSNKVGDLESIVSNSLEKIANDAHNRMKELRSQVDALNSEYKQAVVAHNKDFNEHHTWYDTALDAISNSTNASEEDKAAAKEALGAVDNSITKVQDTASKLTENLDNVSDADIDAYMTSLKELNKNYEDANNKAGFFKRTDFNEQYVTSIAKANDFDVTLADGSKVSFSEFSAEMATKSPRIAKAMYSAKADRLETEGHPVLAKIERAKAAMVGTWIGSKLTKADNQVRNQFNQMAKTNMRATYAAYNNVLKDSNATPEAKAEASAAIEQANSLMTASAALQASTGFFSGIGDGMGDGVYGTTDPEALNAYQKTLNTIDNFVKITLGLGVTPGANKAYQNMYYMSGAKVNSSPLFSKDFDSDGFALCQEYGNSAAAGMIAGAGELATSVALFFNPSTAGMALNLVIDSINTFTNGLYGVAKEVDKSEKYTKEVLGYFKEAQSIVADTGNQEALDAISEGISQIEQTENFELKSDEVGDLDNWLEGSGSNTATNEKFNQSLTYDEWLKLIEADPTMRDYAKKLIAEKKEK